MNDGRLSPASHYPAEHGTRYGLMATIFIVDAHALFREGLKMLLSFRDATAVVGEASCAQDAYLTVRDVRPNIIIFSMAAHEGSARTIVSEFASVSPSSRIIILSDIGTGFQIRELLEAGIAGFVLKTSAYKELDLALRVVLSGLRFLSPEVSELRDDLMASKKASCDGCMEGRFTTLTSRERRILHLFCDEKPPNVIAAELGISRKTVDIHKRNIRRKLGVESDIGLVRLILDADSSF